MFTGIVEARGEVREVQQRGGDRRICIRVPAALGRRLRPGDSVAVSGVCLTAVEPTETAFCADVSCETLALTTAGRWTAGTLVNLEPALTLEKPLGGHLVSGHVDGLGELIERHAEARSERMEFRLPPALDRYVARKGSITVDGVSLTVNVVEAGRFGVNIVPHTLEVTTLGALAPGDAVNLEVDLVARYLERLVAGKEQDS